MRNRRIYPLINQMKQYKKVFLGIDTSNYTTSSALCDEKGEVLLNVKIPLQVKDGERGLRQSDAVFQHIKNLPTAAGKIGDFIRNNDCRIAAVGFSAYPRGIEGSYMPCFLAGESSAVYAAEACSVPLYKTSHQAGHIMAAVYSSCADGGADINELIKEEFLAFHVSGGTTDLLRVQPDLKEIFEIEHIGGTRDINCGQAIDRAGVMMGLKFPCGPELDKAALVYEGKTEKTRLSVNGMECNLSGLENKSAELFAKNNNVSETSAYVLDYIARTLEALTLNAINKYGEKSIIYAGGVMSSKYIKERLNKYGMFADAAYSSDNAAGVALITREKYYRENNEQY